MTVIPADGVSDDCVFARFWDPQNYYALCLSHASAWQLLRMREGVPMMLQKGPLVVTAGSSHQLVLDVNEDQIQGGVDGEHFNVTDAALPAGAIGVGSASTSAFPLVCVVPQ